jgi:hypothetical protein
MLAKWILAAALHLSPNRNHDQLADAVSKVIAAQGPLFQNDTNNQKTAALMLSVAFREGSLLPGIKGDKDKRGNFTSFCTAQIHLPGGAKTLEGWTGDELADDFEKCFTVQHRMLKESMRVCPKHPIAFYAEGKNSETCESNRAQRISNDRMWLAGNLVKKVEWPAENHAGQPALRTVPAQVYARRMFWSGPD